MRKTKIVKKPKKKPVPAEKSAYTRIQSIADAMRQGAATRPEILAKADQLYVQHGGNSNARETIWALMHSRATLLAFGFATEADDRLILKRRRK